MSMPIRRINRPPCQSVAESVDDFLETLGGPTWIDIPGDDPARCRVVAGLLHGNEPSSVRAMHAWLRSDKVPAVRTVFYIGSVAAALAIPRFSHRALPGERDANRVYGDGPDDCQGRIARAFTALFQALDVPVEAVVDIHNNTGHNPAYGVGFGIDRARLNLTHLFADWYMHSDLRLDTLVEMTGARCPSIALECGRAGDPGADAVALAGLDRFLHVPDLGLDAPKPPVRVLEHPVQVRVNEGVTLAVADAPEAGVDLTLREDVDRHNFQLLRPGVAIGWLGAHVDAWPITARRTSGDEVTASLFERRGAVLYTREPMVPVMMTTNVEVARSDCLFYAMRPPEGERET